MREIKFRGKRLDNGERVYGVPLETGISGVFMWCVGSVGPRVILQLGWYPLVKQI